MRSRIIFGILLLLLPVSLFAQKAIDDFWSYIKANESKIYAADAGDRELAAEMHEQIALIDPNLGVYYGERNSNKRRWLLQQVETPNCLISPIRLFLTAQGLAD